MIFIEIVSGRLLRWAQRPSNWRLTPILRLSSSWKRIILQLLTEKLIARARSRPFQIWKLNILFEPLALHAASVPQEVIFFLIWHPPVDLISLLRKTKFMKFQKLWNANFVCSVFSKKNNFLFWKSIFYSEKQNSWQSKHFKIFLKFCFSLW